VKREEGVIQFGLALSAPSSPDGADAIAPQLLADMNAVRGVLRLLGLVGCSPDRYGGLGYGNLSVRAAANEHGRGFWITASQTGALEVLGPDDVCRIDGWDTSRFLLAATGRQAPSSEAITHAMIYDSDDSVRWVLHVHDAPTWSAARRLGLAATAADAGNGSPAMASEVRLLLAEHAVRPLIFVTPGHEDGVFAAGPDAAETAAALAGAFVAARLQP
jgi:ribulose-5-phosphate 4-epimerase/fuculose-1-phosphate aldolase